VRQAPIDHHSPHHPRNLPVAHIFSEDLIDLRHFSRDFLGITLGQAAGDDELLAGAELSQLGELEDALASTGLDVAGPVSQARVLSAAGIGAELEDGFEEPLTARRAAERNAIARLVAPGGMGESIRVLLASRDSGEKDSLLAWPSSVQSH